MNRRGTLKSALVATAAAFGVGRLATPASAQTKPGQPTYHYLPANSEIVHWGYFSKLLKPQLEVDSGDYITIEAITHHAGDAVPVRIGESSQFTNSGSMPLELLVIGVAKDMAAKTQLLTGAPR